MIDTSHRTVLVVGASRGLGSGIAHALAATGDHVIAVARTSAADTELAENTDTIQTELADASDPTVTATLLTRHDPDLVVVVAGATPNMTALQHQTWETFSVNWHTDVKITFEWLRQALLQPLRPGSRVIVISSGAAVVPGGSPLSGGYAGAKATQHLITGYAQDEANRSRLGITFTTVLPKFAPTTGIGGPAVQAYADRAAMPLDDFLAAQGPLVTPDIAGAAIVNLAHADATTLAAAYLLTGDGLQDLPAR